MHFPSENQLGTLLSWLVLESQHWVHFFWENQVPKAITPAFLVTFLYKHFSNDLFLTFVLPNTYLK
jgi:hypothetical protein